MGFKMETEMSLYNNDPDLTKGVLIYTSRSVYSSYLLLISLSCVMSSVALEKLCPIKVCQSESLSIMLWLLFLRFNFQKCYGIVRPSDVCGKLLSAGFPSERKRERVEEMESERDD